MNQFNPETHETEYFHFDKKRMLEDANYCQHVQFYSNTVEQEHVDGHHIYHVDYRKENEDYPHHHEFGVSVKHYFDKDD